MDVCVNLEVMTPDHKDCMQTVNIQRLPAPLRKSLCAVKMSRFGSLETLRGARARAMRPTSYQGPGELAVQTMNQIVDGILWPNCGPKAFRG
jgi:hypothetical protein